MGTVSRAELDAQAAIDKSERERKAKMTRVEKKAAIADRMKVLDEHDREQELLFPDNVDTNLSSPPSPTMSV